MQLVGYGFCFLLGNVGSEDEAPVYNPEICLYKGRAEYIGRKLI